VCGLDIIHFTELTTRYGCPMHPQCYRRSLLARSARLVERSYLLRAEAQRLREALNALAPGRAVMGAKPGGPVRQDRPVPVLSAIIGA